MVKSAKIPPVFFFVFFLVFVLLTIQFVMPGIVRNQPLTGGAQLTGHEVQNVTLAYGASLTSNFRNSAPSGTTLGEYFSGDAVRGILNQTGCIGLRIYYGKKSDGTPALVLSGVSGNGSDLAGGVICETGFPCPPVCDVTSPLEH